MPVKSSEKVRDTLMDNKRFLNHHTDVKEGTRLHGNFTLNGYDFTVLNCLIIYLAE